MVFGVGSRAVFVQCCWMEQNRGGTTVIVYMCKMPSRSEQRVGGVWEGGGRGWWVDVAAPTPDGIMLQVPAGY